MKNTIFCFATLGLLTLMSFSTVNDQERSRTLKIQENTLTKVVYRDDKYFYLTFPELGGPVISVFAGTLNGENFTINNFNGSVFKSLAGDFTYTGRIDCSAGIFYFNEDELE